MTNWSFERGQFKAFQCYCCCCCSSTCTLHTLFPILYVVFVHIQIQCTLVQLHAKTPIVNEFLKIFEIGLVETKRGYHQFLSVKDIQEFVTLFYCDVRGFCFCFVPSTPFYLILLKVYKSHPFYVGHTIIGSHYSSRVVSQYSCCLAL